MVKNVTCDDAGFAGPVYRLVMVSILRTLTCFAAFTVLPAHAAEGAAGIVRVGPAILVFGLAALLLIALGFRASPADLPAMLSRKLARMRIRRALHALSRDALHDLILPGAYGGLAKIDHAVLTAGGILCIRALPYDGSIFGTEDEPQWSSVNGPKRRRFLNPIIQNEGRRRAVQKAVPGAPVTNLVVFPDTAEFKSAMPKNVIHLCELESFVAKFVFGPSRVDDWDAIWLSLKAAALDSVDARKDYAAQVGFS